MENRTAALKSSKMNLQAMMTNKSRSSESESEFSKYWKTKIIKGLK